MPGYVTCLTPHFGISIRNYYDKPVDLRVVVVVTLFSISFSQPTPPSTHPPTLNSPATSRMTQLTVRKDEHSARQPVRQLSLSHDRGSERPWPATVVDFRTETIRGVKPSSRHLNIYSLDDFYNLFSAKNGTYYYWASFCWPKTWQRADITNQKPAVGLWPEKQLLDIWLYNINSGLSGGFNGGLMAQQWLNIGE